MADLIKETIAQLTDEALAFANGYRYMQFFS